MSMAWIGGFAWGMGATFLFVLGITFILLASYP